VRLGINTTALDDEPSGVRTRLEGLVPALLEADPDVSIVLYLARGARRPVAPAGPWVTHVETHMPAGRPVRRMLGSRFWPKLVRSDGVTVFLTDYFPVLTSPPTLVTLHDMRSLLGFGSRLRSLYFRLRLPRVLSRAAGIVVPSGTVKEEAAARLGLDPGAIHVVGNAPGADLSADGPAEEAEEPYVLHVGPDSPRKNLDALRGSPVPVVLAGRPPQRDAPPFRPVGVVPRERLVRLLRGARALVEPSLCEGFGIPVLEAMACGTPVVAARAGALPEVCGDAAVLVDPRDPGAWTDAIGDLLENEERRADLARRGVAQAARHTWAGAAAALLAAARAVT
jgi:glycosyltransferase involved in cell wall biosynthesis